MFSKGFFEKLASRKMCKALCAYYAQVFTYVINTITEMCVTYI